MAKLKFQNLTGMRDILPELQPYFKQVAKAVENVADYYGFERIDVPVLEQAEIYYKGTGVGTDIVEKEMYVFRTKGGDQVALRPEFTPGVVRAFIQHGMHNVPQPVKLWTIGSCFRHERPQAGRYRELRQFNFEVIGEKDASIDSQIIQMGYNVLKELGFKDLTIEVNSIGDSECRPYFKKTLNTYLRSRKSSLCANCQRRAKENPLRIFDCKEEKCQRIKNEAPQIIDHLCPVCHQHFKQVLETLDELELPYCLNPYLVRGLDYYTKTVFEIMEKGELGELQGSLVGGGRYDGLVKILGGRDTPAAGGAGGIDRIVNLLNDKKKKSFSKAEPKIFLAQLGQLAKRKSAKLLEEFREAKLPVAQALSKDSLKPQLSIANKMGIRWVLILGQKEALEGFVTLKDMETGSQKEIKLDKVVREMKRKIK